MMRSLRVRLPIVLAVVLVLQSAAVLAPTVLSAAGLEAEACTCPGGVHAATCPMHHSKGAQSQNDANRCALKSASGPSAVAFSTMMSGAGVPPSIVTVDIAAQSSEIPSAGTVSVRSQFVLPDAPPPRP